MGQITKVGGIPFTEEELSRIRLVDDTDTLRNYYTGPIISPILLNGAKVRDLMVGKLAGIVSEMEKSIGKVPGLCIIQSGNKPESNTYVAIKERKAREAGFYVVKKKFEKGASQVGILNTIESFNMGPQVHGIIVQLPLAPKGKFNLEQITEAIDPEKDADCFHPYNVGKFISGKSYLLAPATPQGSLMILEAYGVPLAHKDGTPYSAAVIGRGDLAGKPMLRVLEASYDIDSCLMNSNTNVKKRLREGKFDIIVSAIGKPNYFGPEDIPDGTKIIIDIGTNYINNPQYKKGAEGIKGNKEIQVGDFTREAYAKANVAIPSPNGAGPGTVMALLLNTFYLACMQEQYAPKEIALK